jgi:hypothetical protein
MGGGGSQSKGVMPVPTADSGSQTSQRCASAMLRQTWMMLVKMMMWQLMSSWFMFPIEPLKIQKNLKIFLGYGTT